MAERLSGEKRPREASNDEARRKAKKVLEDEKKRTEACTREFCEAMQQWMERWEGRMKDVRTVRPVDPEPPTEIDTTPSTATTSEVQGLVDHDDSLLVNQLLITETDARDLNDALYDIELWILLHQSKIVREGCFGTKLQVSTLNYVGKLRAMALSEMTCLTTYYKSKSAYETSVLRYKYPQSYSLLWLETSRIAWQEMENFYASVYHRTMMLYVWLRDREDKLRHPKTDAVL